MTKTMTIICICIAAIPWIFAALVWVGNFYVARQIKHCKKRVLELEKKRNEMLERGQ